MYISTPLGLPQIHLQCIFCSLPQVVPATISNDDIHLAICCLKNIWSHYFKKANGSSSYHGRLQPETSHVHRFKTPKHRGFPHRLPFRAPPRLESILCAAPELALTTVMWGTGIELGNPSVRFHSSIETFFETPTGNGIYEIIST
jgi:hypothetical protein